MSQSKNDIQLQNNQNNIEKDVNFIKKFKEQMATLLYTIPSVTEITNERIQIHVSMNESDQMIALLIKDMEISCVKRTIPSTYEYEYTFEQYMLSNSNENMLYNINKTNNNNINNKNASELPIPYITFDFKWRKCFINLVQSEMINDQKTTVKVTPLPLLNISTIKIGSKIVPNTFLGSYILHAEEKKRKKDILEPGSSIFFKNDISSVKNINNQLEISKDMISLLWININSIESYISPTIISSLLMILDQHNIENNPTDQTTNNNITNANSFNNQLMDNILNIEFDFNINSFHLYYSIDNTENISAICHIPAIYCSLNVIPIIDISLQAKYDTKAHYFIPNSMEKCTWRRSISFAIENIGIYLPLSSLSFSTYQMNSTTLYDQILHPKIYTLFFIKYLQIHTTFALFKSIKKQNDPLFIRTSLELNTFKVQYHNKLCIILNSILSTIKKSSLIQATTINQKEKVVSNISLDFKFIFLCNNTQLIISPKLSHTITVDIPQMIFKTKAIYQSLSKYSQITFSYHCNLLHVYISNYQLNSSLHKKLTHCILGQDMDYKNLSAVWKIRLKRLINCSNIKEFQQTLSQLGVIAELTNTAKELDQLQQDQLFKDCIECNEYLLSDITDKHYTIQLTNIKVKNTFNIFTDQMNSNLFMPIIEHIDIEFNLRRYMNIIQLIRDIKPLKDLLTLFSNAKDNNQVKETYQPIYTTKLNGLAPLMIPKISTTRDSIVIPLNDKKKIFVLKY